MAKINARGARQVGPTLFTERVRPALDGDVERVYYEAWRLRSDGWIQSRIVRTWPASGKGHTTEHRGSSFRNWRRFKDHAVDMVHHNKLRELLERMRADVVKESY